MKYQIAAIFALVYVMTTMTAHRHQSVSKTATMVLRDALLRPAKVKANPVRARAKARVT
jgi:hypothetical protein